jgi:hypothetical protein
VDQMALAGQARFSCAAGPTPSYYMPALPRPTLPILGVVGGRAGGSESCWCIEDDPDNTFEYARAGVGVIGTERSNMVDKCILLPHACSSRDSGLSVDSH